MINENPLEVTPELEKVINEITRETGGFERLRGNNGNPLLNDNNEESKEESKSADITKDGYLARSKAVT